jgi:hypothetical protein
VRQVIRLEQIADDFFATRSHLRFDEWLRYMRKLGTNKEPSAIYQLTLQNDKITRKFITGTRDYSQANATGSRGIFAFYPLKPGVYEVNDRYKFNRVDHYFCKITDDKITRITREEATQCLKNI